MWEIAKMTIISGSSSYWEIESIFFLSESGLVDITSHALKPEPQEMFLASNHVLGALLLSRALASPSLLESDRPPEPTKHLS